MEPPDVRTYQNLPVVWPRQIEGLPYEIHRYRPFGEDFADLGSPAVDNDLRFTGRLLDGGADKLYLHARWYSHDQSLGPPAINRAEPFAEHTPRFLSPDPAPADPFRSQTWNRFSFCGNDPADFIDQTGEVYGWALFRASVGVVANGLAVSTGAVVQACPVAGQVAGALLIGYGAYGLGAHAANFVNAIQERPPIPTGPAEAGVRVAEAWLGEDYWFL